MRGWGGPDVYTRTVPGPRLLLKAPRAHLLNPVASRTVLPLQELRTKLGMDGKTPDQIAEGVSGGVRQRRDAEDGNGGIRVHVLCGPGARSWSWPVAPAHNVVHPVLRELHTGRGTR